MRFVLAALVAGTGCAQLFSIDETTAADANTDFASVEVQRVSIGASVVKSPQDLSMQSAKFYDATTFTPVDGVLAGTNMFTADVPGTPAALFTVPDTAVPTRMWALPARNQRGNYNVFEHPNPQPPFDNSALNVQVTLPTPYVSTESFIIQAIGTWMQHSMTAAELPLPDMALSTISAPMILYSTFTAMAGNAKDRIARADTVLVTRYTAAAGGVMGNSKLTGVLQAQQFDQADAVDPLSGAMTVVATSTPVIAQIMPAAYQTRFAAARPAVAGLSMPWRVTAAPGWSIAADGGVRLINGASAVADTEINATFGNPFESLDWKAVLTFSASSSRAYAFSDGTNMASLNLFATLTTVTEPSSSLSITMAAGLPSTVRANDTLLTTDGMMLPLDLTKPVSVDAIIDKTTNTAYNLSLVELGFDTSGAAAVLTRKTILDVLTVGTPTFKIPPDLLTVGKSYYITIRCYEGAFVNAATGDLQTVTLPYSAGALDSAVFTVGMP